MSVKECFEVPIPEVYDTQCRMLVTQLHKKNNYIDLTIFMFIFSWIIHEKRTYLCILTINVTRIAQSTKIGGKVIRTTQFPLLSQKHHRHGKLTLVKTFCKVE